MAKLMGDVMYKIGVLRPGEKEAVVKAQNEEFLEKLSKSNADPQIISDLKTFFNTADNKSKYSYFDAIKMTETDYNPSKLRVTRFGEIAQRLDFATYTQVELVNALQSVEDINRFTEKDSLSKNIKAKFKSIYSNKKDKKSQKEVVLESWDYIKNQNNSNPNKHSKLDIVNEAQNLAKIANLLNALDVVSNGKIRKLPDFKNIKKLLNNYAKIIEHKVVLEFRKEELLKHEQLKTIQGFSEKNQLLYLKQKDHNAANYIARKLQNKTIDFDLDKNRISDRQLNKQTIQDIKSKNNIKDGFFKRTVNKIVDAIQYIGEKVKQGVQYIGKICYKAFSFVRNEFNNRTNNLETYQIPLKEIPKSVLDKTAKLSSNNILFKLGKLIESLPGRAIDQKRLLKLGIDPDHINIDPELERWKQKATELLDAKVKEAQAPLKADEAKEYSINNILLDDKAKERVRELLKDRISDKPLSVADSKYLDEIKKKQPNVYKAIEREVAKAEKPMFVGMAASV